MFSLIAFSGHQGSGKDYSADYLVEKHGYIKVKFAAFIQDIVAVLGDEYNTDLSHRKLFEDRRWKEETPYFNKDLNIDSKLFKATPRQLMQDIGEGLRTNIDSFIWCALTYRTISKLVLAGNNKIVISDLRYPNEVSLVKDVFKGKVVMLSTSSSEVFFSKVKKDNKGNIHSSESHYAEIASKADYYLYNSYKDTFHDTKEYLAQLDKIVRETLEGKTKDEVIDVLSKDFNLLIKNSKLINSTSKTKIS